jgi:hypothetical protein
MPSLSAQEVMDEVPERKVGEICTKTESYGTHNTVTRYLQSTLIVHFLEQVLHTLVTSGEMAPQSTGRMGNVNSHVPSNDNVDRVMSSCSQKAYDLKDVEVVKGQSQTAKAIEVHVIGIHNKCGCRNRVKEDTAH